MIDLNPALDRVAERLSQATLALDGIRDACLALRTTVDSMRMQPVEPVGIGGEGALSADAMVANAVADFRQRFEKRLRDALGEIKAEPELRQAVLQSFNLLTEIMALLPAAEQSDFIARMPDALRTDIAAVTARRAAPAPEAQPSGGIRGGMAVDDTGVEVIRAAQDFVREVIAGVPEGYVEIPAGADNCRCANIFMTGVPRRFFCCRTPTGDGATKSPALS